MSRSLEVGEIIDKDAICLRFVGRTDSLNKKVNDK